ncbi:MAG: hypothetical protein AAF960_06840 [Bacteroidota bacterium]
MSISQRVTFLVLAFSVIACAQTKQLFLSEDYKETIKNSLELAIQHGGKAILDENGKSNCDYEMVSGTWEEYEAMWHTGQLIQGLLTAYAVTNNEQALFHARRAGDWWVSRAYPEGHHLAGYVNAAHGGKLGKLINTTTVADGTPGLFDLTDVTKDKKYADVATSAGKWILDNLYLPEERLSYNIVDSETGEIWKDRSPHRQHQGLPFNIRHMARPNAEGYLWGDMYRHTGEQHYLDAFLEICDGLVDTQSDNGWWMEFEPNDPKTGKIHGRFNTWNAEALVEAYDLTKDKKYLDAATETAKALARIQQDNGMIYYNSFTDGTFDKRSPCGSATSFAGILWLRLHELGNPAFEENIKAALQFTLANQYPIDHADENLAGGYLEIRQKGSKKGRIKVIFRDISTSFGMRFLSDVYRHVYKNP